MEFVYRYGVLVDPAIARRVAKTLLLIVGGIALCGLLLGMELVAQSGGTSMADSIGLMLVNLMAIHLG